MYPDKKNAQRGCQVWKTYLEGDCTGWSEKDENKVPIKKMTPTSPFPDPRRTGMCLPSLPAAWRQTGGVMAV